MQWILNVRFALILFIRCVANSCAPVAFKAEWIDVTSEPPVGDSCIQLLAISTPSGGNCRYMSYASVP